MSDETVQGIQSGKDVIGRVVQLQSPEITHKYSIKDEAYMDFISGKRSIMLKCPDCSKIIYLEIEKADIK